MRKKRMTNKKGKKNKFLLLGTIILLFILSIVFISLNYTNRLNKSKVNIDNIEVNTEKEIEFTKFEGIKNILLLSSDARNKDTSSRADSIMILTIDTNNKKIKLTSLMRDMLVNIQGHGEEKLNHAFAYGGPKKMVETVQNNFGVKIDDYVVVDFKGFVDIIDILGGVEIEIKDYEVKELNKYILDGGGSKKDLLSKEGTYNLNGYQVLSYVRIRKAGNGDYERTDRQRKTLTLIFEKIKTVNLTSIPSIIDKCIEHTDTIMTVPSIINTLFTVLELNCSIETLSIPFENTFIERVYQQKGFVFVFDKVANSKVLQEFISKDIEYIPNSDLSNLAWEYDNKYR